jgi:hypothetical protein
VQPAPERRIAFLNSQPNDDKIWAMFNRYVFVTVKQAQTILGCASFSYINVRLRRLWETGYLGRVQQNDFSPLLYFISKKGAEEAVLRGEMRKPWCIQKKSLMQIPHDIGITNCQILLDQNFPELEVRRWKTDLQKDFEGEVPDLYFDLHDGTGWCPFEYVRTNPLSRDKMKDYASGFERTYIVLPTMKAVQFALLTANELHLPNASHLWFTYEEMFTTNVKGKIWWNPKTMGDKAYSILKPEI